MRYFFFLLLAFSATAQTKQQLTASIIKDNILDCDCVGATCQEGPQYLKFQKLKKLLSDTELAELTTHTNATIRMFASGELIETGKADVVKLLLAELDHYEKVKTLEGCIMDEEWTYSIVYHNYWNKIRGEAMKGFNNSEDPAAIKAMSDRVEEDSRMQELDSIIITTDKNIWWLLYGRAFSNRKFDEKLLPRIETLAFQKNNAAFTYLDHYYSAKYQGKFKKYWLEVFPKANFNADNDNERFYFLNLIEIALDNSDADIRNIAVKKIKVENWIKKDSFRIKEMFEARGIKY